MGTSEAENGEEAFIGIKVDPELKREIRVAAAERGLSISEFLRRAAASEIGTE